MNPQNIKLGDKVIIISNRAGSLHKIGDIGIVSEMTHITHCLVTVNGIGKEGWHNSYFTDLMKLVPELHKNIRVL